MLDGGAPKGLRNYFRGGYAADLGDDFIDGCSPWRAHAITDVGAAPAPDGRCGCESGGGRDSIQRPRRWLPYNVVSTWMDAGEDVMHIEANREFSTALAPLSEHGSYVNFLTDSDGERVRAAYGDELYTRLARLKREVRLVESVQPQPECQARAMTDARRFLIATWDGGGNTPPALHLGTRLARRGHRVRILGWESMARRCEAAGLEFATYASMTRWPESLSLDDGWDRLVPFLQGTATRDDILAEAAACEADVLVFDCMIRAGFEAARQLGLPAAVLVHALYSAWVSPWGDQVMQASVGDLLAAAEESSRWYPPGSMLRWSCRPTLPTSGRSRARRQLAKLTHRGPPISA